MARVDEQYTDWLNAEQEQDAMDAEQRQTLARQLLLQTGLFTEQKEV